MTPLATPLLAIYVVAVWPGTTPNTIRWQEFPITQHETTHNTNTFNTSVLDRTETIYFHNLGVCERYRTKLVAAWVADPSIPFHKQDIVSSRCGPWYPDPNAGTKL